MLKDKNKKRKKNSQIPSQDLKLIIWKVLCRHLTKVSLTMVVHLLLDYLYALFDLVFPSYTFNQSVSIKATIASTRHWWFSGRILTYQAGDPGSIPASTSVLFDMDKKECV